MSRPSTFFATAAPFKLLLLTALGASSSASQSGEGLTNEIPESCPSPSSAIV